MRDFTFNVDMLRLVDNERVGGNSPGGGHNTMKIIVLTDIEMLVYS